MSPVTIVGAGPAGCAAALELRRIGMDVTLIDIADGPTGRSGRLETVSGAAQSLLERMVPPDAIVIARPAMVATRRLDWFGTRSTDVEQSGLLANRRRLHDLLRRAAQQAGATLITDRVVGLDPDGARPRLRLRSHPDRLIDSPVIVDARGRAAGKSNSIGPPRVAVTAAVMPFADGETRLTTLPASWAWAASTAMSACLMVVVDPSVVAGLDAAGRRELLAAICDRSDLLRDLSIDPHSTPSVHLATATTGDPLAGSRSIRIGDCALAYDPIAGQGLAHAIRSGAQVAPVVATLLDPDGDHIAARRFVVDQHRHDVDQHRAGLGRLLAASSERRASPGAFWTDYREAFPFPRAGAPHAIEPTGRWALSASAEMALTPTLVDDRIVSSTALCHHTLGQPVAYVSGVPVADLHPLLRERSTRHEMVARLTPWLGPANATAFVDELQRCGTLEPA